MLEELDELLESGEVVACQAVCIFADGYKYEMTVIAPPKDIKRGRVYELWFVKHFNQSQLRMKNKMVDLHILKK